MTSSPVGAIPLGVFFTDSMSRESNVAAFKLFKEQMGDEAFGGQRYPSVAMTDDSTPEREAFHEVWPETRLLLCLFHVPQAIWRWLYNAKNNINHGDRQNLMHDFLLVMRSKSEEEATRFYEYSSQNAVAQNYNNWLVYLQKYWERRTLWCVAYR